MAHFPDRTLDDFDKAILRIIVTTNMRAYEALTRRLFAENDTIGAYRTQVALDRVKTDTALAIA